jgi:hypothetical protein
VIPNRLRPRGSRMRKDATTNLLLMLIAIALIAIAIRPYLAPDPVHAQSGSPYPYLYRTRHSDAARARRQPAGLRKSDRGQEDRKSLGLPHLQFVDLPSERNGQQAAGFPPLRAGQVCPSTILTNSLVLDMLVTRRQLCPFSSSIPQPMALQFSKSARLVSASRCGCRPRCPVNLSSEE